MAFEDNEDDVYDEFGNYIGPDLDDEDDHESDEADNQSNGEQNAEGRVEAGADGHTNMDTDASEANQNLEVVLHEDKKHYPDAEEVFGPETETIVQDDDAQPIEEPIIKPVKKIEAAIEEKQKPETSYNDEFLKDVLKNQRLVRNVAVIGHLHHGKTSLCDMLVDSTHPNFHIYDAENRSAKASKQKYTDTRNDEHAKKISMKCTPITLLLRALKGKNNAFNLVDCPGHVDFSGEAVSAMRLCDGVTLVVDVAEGPLCMTSMMATHAARESLPMTLVLNKVDRLITELKLPPSDAYHKIRSVIEHVNDDIEEAGGRRLDPREGSVTFASARYGWSFTLETFARMYTDRKSESRGGSGAALAAQNLAGRMWGDMWLDEKERKILKGDGQGTKKDANCKRTFVAFVLEPIYKIHTLAVGEHPKTLERAMSELNLQMQEKEKKYDVEKLLRTCMRRLLGPDTCVGLVEMMTQYLPTAHEFNEKKLSQTWSGGARQESDGIERVKKGDANAPLLCSIAKLYPKQDASGFNCFLRVHSGKIQKGDRVRVLGEGFSLEDDEESADCTVKGISLLQARYTLKLDQATPGMLVLVEGIEQMVTKTATVVNLPTKDVHADEEEDDNEPDHPEHHKAFSPLQFVTKATVKIAVEPLNPSELPQLVDGLRSITRSFPMVETRVEESGEHILIGNGELHLDTAMKDLRHLFADVEVKVSDPVTVFRESIAATSAIQCQSVTPNGENAITLIAEPMERKLIDDIEEHTISLSMKKKDVERYFQDELGYDLLASRSVWAFGPESDSPNLILNDTLPSEVDRKTAQSLQTSVTEGFRWATREGPLCDEPMRGVRLKLTGMDLSEQRAKRTAGQIIPTVRKAIYSAFLSATPTLLEPIFSTEVVTTSECISACHEILNKRRGHIVSDKPREGTPVFVLRGHVPVIESFGLETDIRYHTQGQAFCMSWFNRFDIVPGDPLNKDLDLKPLEPSPHNTLAREFSLKTRRRKGLADDVSTSKFLDDPSLLDEVG